MVSTRKHGDRKQYLGSCFCQLRLQIGRRSENPRFLWLETRNTPPVYLPLRNFRDLVHNIFHFSPLFFPCLWSSPSFREHKGKPSTMTLKRLAGTNCYSNELRHAFQSPVESNEYFPELFANRPISMY